MGCESLPLHLILPPTADLFIRDERSQSGTPSSAGLAILSSSAAPPLFLFKRRAESSYRTSVFLLLFSPQCHLPFKLRTSIFEHEE